MVAGVTVPQDQPDGVYTVTYDSDGNANHTLIAPPLSKEEVARRVAARGLESVNPSRILARQKDSTDCGNYGLDRASTDAAVEMLKGQCTPYGSISSGYNFYSISGSTVAYICNVHWNAWTCFRDDITNDLRHITNICGLYMSGWRRYYRDGNTGAQTGYEDRNAEFCDRGIDH
jgi:hypothetical protein